MTHNTNPTAEALGLNGYTSIEEVEILFEELHDINGLWRESDLDARTTALISTCIMIGIDSRSGIRAALLALGLDPEGVTEILDSKAGPDPAPHRWYRDAAGAYHNYPHLA